jgi:hypothetical protein
MVWAAIGAAAIGVVGGAMNAHAGKQNAQTAQGMSEADRQFYRDTYNQSLQDNRANQQTDFGSLSWQKDPTTGQWTQQNRLNPADAARLEDYRQIAADRMGAARGGYHTDWNSLGFGNLAHAVLGTPGDTGRVHGSGFGLNYKPGEQHSSYPSAGGSIMQTGREIAPNYTPGSQFTAPVAPPPTAATPVPPGLTPEQQQQAAIADALRRQQDNAAMNSGNGSG